MGNVFLFLALMVPGTFLLGVYDVFVRRILREGKVDEQLLMAFAYTTSGALLTIPLLFFGIPELEVGFWQAALATTVLNIFGQWAWFAAFKREDASLIAPLRLLTPPLVILSGYLVLREAPTAGGVIGIVVTIVGLWLLMQGEAAAASLRLGEIIRKPGIVFGILGAISFAVSFPFDKQAVVSSSALFALVVVFLALGLASGLIAFARKRTNLAFDVRGNWRLLLIMPFVHASAAYLTFAALNYALAAYAASVKRLWSLWTVVLSGQFLKERNIGRKLLATAVMLAGLAVTLVLG